jgi:hypothetical protein
MQEEAKNSEEEIRDREEINGQINNNWNGIGKIKSSMTKKEVEEKELGTREHPYIAACMQLKLKPKLKLKPPSIRHHSNPTIEK